MFACTWEGLGTRLIVARMHPNYGLVTILLAHDPLSSLALSVEYNLMYTYLPHLEVLTRQRKQLEQIHHVSLCQFFCSGELIIFLQMRDNYVQELSRLRATNDEKKVELSRLRMEVSEGPSVSSSKM